MPDCQQSTRTAGGSIIGQATAGYRPGEERPNLQLWMFVSSTSIKPMPMQDGGYTRAWSLRSGHHLWRPATAAWDEDRPSCRPFRQRPDSMQQAARGFACGL